MTEVILIEISQRFRRMEDLIGAATIEFEDEEDGDREELEKAVEACREDMVAMQEKIRRRWTFETD